MRRRRLTRFEAVDAGLSILGPASPERDLVVVRWDKRARRRWRRRLFRARLARIDAMLIRAGFVTPDELRAQRWPADGVPVRLGGEVVGRAWQVDDGTSRAGITTAVQLVEPLRAGLLALHAEPARFMPLNPSNGWGSYDTLVEFVSEYLAACEAYPGAAVEASR